MGAAEPTGAASGPRAGAGFTMEDQISIDLERGVLRVSGSLDWSTVGHFDDACRRLVAGPEAHPMVDLSDVHGLSSPYLGILAQAALACMRQDRKMTLKMPSGMSSRFEVLKFNTLARIEVV